MGDHLRLAGQPFEVQREELIAMVRDEPALMEVLETIRELPEGLVVSGAIYNLVWNRQTGRPPFHGVADIDVFYFDASDLSYDAEDAAIQRLAPGFSHLPVPVQIRNQARVHLWFEAKFGCPFAPLHSAAEMLARFASKTHAVGVQLGDRGRLDVVAPFGLDDIFSFRVVPNHALDNRTAHERKGERAKALWPEVTVLPWD